MLATGRSSAAAIEAVKKAGARSVTLVCLVAAPEGIEHLRGEHPDVRIVDRRGRPRAEREGLHRARPRRRGRPALRDEVEAVWPTLTDHLEVVYGAVLALVIVVLLTPAVGGMARMLGVVDRPGARRVNRGSVPRLGGLALFFGIFVPALAFLPLGRETKGLLLGMAVATTVGAIDDFRGLVWWEKLGGQIAAAAIPTGFGIWVHRFTFPIVGVHALPEWVGIPLTIAWIVAIMNMVNFLDGLDGLAAGVCAISGGTFCLIALSLGRPDTGDPRRDRARRLRRLPAPQLLSRPGSSWATPARCCSASRSGRSPSRAS